MISSPSSIFPREELIKNLTGAYLEDVPKEGEPMKIQGSAMVCVATSKEEVIEKLKNDIYGKSGVWDFSKVSSIYAGWDNWLGRC